VSILDFCFYHLSLSLGPALYTVAIILHPGLPTVSENKLMRKVDYQKVKEGEVSEKKSLFRFISFDYVILNGIVKVSQEQATKVNAYSDGDTEIRINNEELPSLLDLIANTKEELDQMMPRLKTLNWILALFPPIQCLTKTGSYCWYCVGWKYWHFFLLSVGIWSESSYQCFNLPNRVQDLVKEEMLEDSYVDAVGTVVSAKAILWQIIPFLSLLSIYTMNTASSPLYTADIEDFRRLSPSYFTRNLFVTSDLTYKVL
jgi:hypothetical protein